jgi:uncharacterized protein YjbJ (UPF0337 family)
VVQQFLEELGPVKCISFRTRCYMNNENVKGAAEKAGGKVKEVAGRVTGDRKLENEGNVDQAKGAVHSAIGDAKDSLKTGFQRR